ncbi:MAG: hypothetical protein CMF62_04920 [Magnetococcales bacterium]|nr:hypothetical protein [Magnetococcales bacterium]
MPTNELSVFKRLLLTLRQTMHLSVSFGDTGHQRMLTPRLWHLVAMAGLILGLLGWSLYYFSYAVSQQSIDPYLKSQLAAKNLQIVALESELSEKTEELAFRDNKMKFFAHELGNIQARLDRFDSIGERLFEDKYFGDYLAELDNIEPVGDGEISVRTPATSVFAIATQLASTRRRTDDVERVMETSLDLLSKTQINRNVQPHHWPVVNKRTYLSSNYGMRTDPFSKKQRWHSGVDIAGGYNAQIVASADGVITFSGYRFGYGIMVEVTHGNGIRTRYGHMNQALVRNGQSVKAGEVVGLMGSSGRSTGPHLHFEVLLGEHKVNPYPFIKDGRENAKMLALSNIQAYDTNRF